MKSTKGRNKVPVMGDIPVLGYLFQEHLNARTKRNLLVFVTPTILEQRYGTGLEDQVTGLHEAVRNTRTRMVGGTMPKARCAWSRPRIDSSRPIYPNPGVAPPPSKLLFRSSAKDRDY